MTSGWRSVAIGVVGLMFCAVAMGSDLTAAVNALRQQAGLPLLSHSQVLADAAGEHAAYLDLHRGPSVRAIGVSAHRQQPGRSGFSGTDPAERAIAAGYPHRVVLENVSMGYDSLAESLDGLMSAIYHRLTFLDFAADEIGSARGERSRVFLLGRSDLSALCSAPPRDALLRPPVDCMGQPMTRAAYERLCAALPESARYRPPHPIVCPNGQQLDAGFMRRLCEAPPLAARYQGVGHYYQPCGRDGPRIDAHWFDALCDAAPPGAAYSGSGRYVELCEKAPAVSQEWFESYCTALPDGDRFTGSGRFQQPCATSHAVRVEYLDQARHRLLAERPDWVVWPPDGTEGFPPAFFVETPDPLPDLEVSGNPVSLQVNPVLASRIELVGFSLFRLLEDREHAVDVRLMNADTDPNGLFTEHEFALFPLQRLDWGAQYRAEARLTLDGEPTLIDWHFKTRRADVPLIEVAGDYERHRFDAGKPFWLYLPPRRGQPQTVLSSRSVYPRGSRVQVKVVDPNTAEITIETRSCDRVSVTFEQERTVELMPNGC